MSSFKKWRKKVGSGETVLYQSTPKWKKITEIAEAFTKIFAAIATLSIFISLIYGAIKANNQYASFGIPFFQLAEIDDYIRLVLSDLGDIFFIVLISVISPVIITLFLKSSFANKFKQHMTEANKTRIKKDTKAKKSINKILLMIAPVPLVVLGLYTLILLGSSLWVLATQDLPRFSFSETIQKGHKGTFKMQYGIGYKKLTCLSFIAQVGGHVYFWSTINKNLVAVSSSQLIKLESQKAPRPEALSTEMVVADAMEWSIKHWEWIDIEEAINRLTIVHRDWDADVSESCSTNSVETNKKDSEQSQ